MTTAESSSVIRGNESTVHSLIQLMRPRQWIKNTFVAAPLVFTGQFTQVAAVVDTGLAILMFCLVSSATYIINDWQDIESDRRHPVKRYRRPLASGSLRPAQALALFLVLCLLIAAGFWLLPELLPVVFAYVALTLAYTFCFKYQPVLDIFSIAGGFVLRVLAGSVVLDVPLSSWMLVTTLCLALYLAAIKRRQELSHSGDSARQVLKCYSVALVDRYAAMAATGALIFYSLFVMKARPELVGTIPLVLFGLFRYWFVVESKNAGESPTDALLGDGYLLATVLLWVGACVWMLWP